MIRPATPDDIPSLLRLIAALAAHHGDASVASPATLCRDLFSQPDWAQALIDDAGRGYAVLIPRASFQNGSRGMDMHHLYVDPDARGTGLGRALVQACADRVRALGGTWMVVGTHPDNRAAQAFYRAQGFTDRGTTPPQFLLKL